MVERLDARVKLIALAGVSVMLFIVNGVVCAILWCLLLAICFRAVGIRLEDLQNVVRFLAIVLAVTIVCNTLRLDGSGSIRLIGPLGVHPTAGLRVGFTILRLAFLAGFALCVAKTTDAPEISRACMRLLKPLTALGVPIYTASVVLNVSLRFMPILSDELRAILASQRSRGADFDNGSVFERIPLWLSVLTPLIVRVFRRADRLAQAMDARCYSPESQGRVESQMLDFRDWLFLGASSLILGGMFAISLC